MQVEPKATFVCPTYNGAGYLAETIESVRNQTVPDWELIVVDDASSDTTQKLMAFYTAEDKRIRYIRHKDNKGAVAARNTGNKAANGDLILVIDHDDLCVPNRLALTLKHFDKHPDTDIFHGGWYECNIYGDAAERWEPVQITMRRFNANNFLFCHSTAAYKKETVLKYPYRLVECRTDDHVAIEDWLAARLRFRTTKKPLCRVRRLPMGQMQKIRAMKGMPPSWRI